MKTLADYAQDCIARGFFIHPLLPGKKEPATSNGFKDATNDEFQVFYWWKENPEFNIGIACGASDLCVLDYDSSAPPDWLPATLTVKTGRGIHKYFSGSRRSGRMLGGDVKSEGSYVVGPGSVHLSGSTYAIIDDSPIAPLPKDFQLPAATAPTLASTDERISKGKRTPTLVSLAGTMRRPGMSEEAIAAALLVVNQQRCEPPLPELKVKEIARSIATRYQPDPNAKPDSSVKPADPNDWRAMFHSMDDFENARPLTFAIKDFLQLDGATLIGGLSGHGKTLIMLALTKALLTGKDTKLWDYFEVLETASRVLYLIPESSLGPFKYRLQLFGLYDFLKDDRLLVRTLSMGATPCLSDPRILSAAKDAHVFLDTAIRFSVEGSENDASDNMRGLASDIFALLGAGARTVVGAQHSPKPFARENVMRLENVLRGSGDIGAMAATAWGIKQLDPFENIIHIENIKPRDFEPPRPFQIIGRPYINQEGDFRMYKKPDECGALQEEQQPDRDRGGAPPELRQERTKRVAMAQEWLAEDPTLSAEKLRPLFKQKGIKVSNTAAKNYKREAIKGPEADSI
jgi:hypothetical protein